MSDLAYRYHDDPRTIIVTPTIVVDPDPQDHLAEIAKIRRTMAMLQEALEGLVVDAHFEGHSQRAIARAGGWKSHWSVARIIDKRHPDR